jgi:hypothetical protein
MRYFLAAVVLIAGGLLVLPATAGLEPKAAEIKLGPPTEKELKASKNNLKQIMLAMHNYAGANQDMWPNNSHTKTGKAMLSWRVAILPFVEQDQLYKQFKLDEAWDSDTNKKLIAKMPKLYAPIRVKAKEGETFYRVFTGQGLFGLEAKYKIGNTPDGESNTGFVFEAGEPVIWTKPDDLVYDKDKKLPKLGGLFDGAFHVAMGDANVWWIKKPQKEVTLQNLIEPDDGNVFIIDE